MMDKLKTVLQSEKAMTVVNLFFLLSLFIRSRGILLIAYTVWIVYLAYLRKNTASKAVRVINGFFIAFALVMLAGNLYFMLKGMR